MSKTKQQFIYSTIIRGIVSFAVLIIVFIALKKLLPKDYFSYLTPITSKPLLVYLVFFVSETIGGIIPPEIFMILELEVNDSPWRYIENLVYLTLLSYLGGVIAFTLGKQLSSSLLVKRLLKSKKTKKYQQYYNDYGGILILISAVTPLPFALISTLSGSLDYSYIKYFKFASLRFLRFIVYGWVIWQANML